MTRCDVASLGEGWNDTLLHYAMAMGELDRLPADDRNSWRFLGAIHGCDPAGWAQVGIVEAEADLPAEVAGPSPTYGRQCQHQSWFFLPWHRGYLASFEAIVAAKVKELTGATWSLPYWNYLDDTNPDALKVPSAFLEDSLPDGTPNPLRKYRIFSETTELPAPSRRRFSLEAMEEDDFLVGNDGTIGFGGGITPNFAQFYGRTGDLEQNPHNVVHGYVGGLMSNPNYAALDPIFWLHHCNIDRLWEAWMRTPGKTMVRDPRWLDGPTDRRFIVPSVGGEDPGIQFTGRDTLRGGLLCPEYDDLTKGTGVTPEEQAVARVSMGPSNSQVVEPIGDNRSVVEVAAVPQTSSIELEPTASEDAARTMGASRTGETVTRLYLALEGVKGEAPSPTIDVYLGLAEGETAQSHPERFAGALTLFGLNVASDPGGNHAGNGLSFTLDITDIAQQLKSDGRLDGTDLAVTIVPVSDVSEQRPVTIERLVIYRRSGTVQ
ncbi:tyrosinase family protein [Rhodobacterales bacterium]|nr:tyrosinase family protein [Rhodobacterales bacterium]